MKNENPRIRLDTRGGVAAVSGRRLTDGGELRLSADGDRVRVSGGQELLGHDGELVGVVAPGEPTLTILDHELVPHLLDAQGTDLGIADLPVTGSPAGLVGGDLLGGEVQRMAVDTDLEGLHGRTAVAGRLLGSLLHGYSPRKGLPHPEWTR